MSLTCLNSIGQTVFEFESGNENIYLFIYLGFYVAFNTVQVISRWVVGRAEETSTSIEFARVVYCKLPTNGKQLPAFPLKAVTGIEPEMKIWTDKQVADKRKKNNKKTDKRTDRITPISKGT